MDPATAIGVSSAVLTFVDVGAKIIQGAIHIYGATNSDTEWENPRDVAAKMHLLARRMRVPTTQDLTWEEEELCELASTCQALSQELAKLFKSILPKNSNSRRQCLWAATKLKLRDDQVSGLEKRLESCREQFELHLTYANYLTGGDMKASLEQLLNGQDKASQKLVRSIEELKEGLKRIEEEQTKPLSPEALAQIQCVVQIQGETINAAIASRILAGLSFSSMHSRYNGIEDAHSSTFQWFFGNNPGEEKSAEEGMEAADSIDGKPTLDKAKAKAKFLFSDWLLKPSSDVLHISGKLGSGKSTLMKFLVDHPRTREALQTWAGNKTLIFASFFFWKAGLAEQRSLPGLLRTLLHDSLQADPTLIPLLLPELWTTAKKNWLTRTPVKLTDREIKDTLARMISSPATAADRRFCFFIDGLDEYEEKPQMDHTDMVNMLKEWSESGADQVKICVSSREDNVFMNAFRADRRIRIHDLTWADMHAFVSNRLSGIVPTDNAANCSNFTIQIVDKAQGIFLWVALVVKEVRRRHENRDIGDMFEFMKYLPVDLEGLFRHIVRDLIHPEDRAMAHRTFFMVISAAAWSIDLTLWEHSFINDYVKNPDFCIDLPMEPIDDPNYAVQSLEPAGNRVRAWCRGLLEISPAYEYRNGRPSVGFESLSISFSHRSISEFLSTEEMKAEGAKWTASFNWEDAYSKMYLASCQSFSAFRLESEMTHTVLEIRMGLHWDLEPPFTYLVALERCHQRRWDANRRKMTQKGATIDCWDPFYDWFVSNRPETGPGVQKDELEPSVHMMPPTPSIHLTLMDGEHPYPSWRLSHDKVAAQDGVLITILCGALIGNSRMLPLHYDHESLYPHLQPPEYRIGYLLLDLLAANRDLNSQLLPGISLRFNYMHPASGNGESRGILHSSETVGFLGQYLMAWFIQCCYWHPTFRYAETLKHIGERLWDSYSESVQASMVEQFGSILERLFQVDPGRLHFEAKATFGFLTDRYCTQITFAIGHLAQRPIWILQQDFHHESLKRDKYTTDIPEVTAQQAWTLEELIITMSPPNRDALLRMISERNSAISGLSALRLDDRGTSEDT